MLAWVPYKIMMQNYATELNPSERLSYIAKATSVEREKTELCHFRHTDLVNNVMDSLFTCVVMIFEDNFVSKFSICYCMISNSQGSLYSMA